MYLYWCLKYPVYDDLYFLNSLSCQTFISQIIHHLDYSFPDTDKESLY